jgi:hypothetical protein
LKFWVYCVDWIKQFFILSIDFQLVKLLKKCFSNLFFGLYEGE